MQDITPDSGVLVDCSRQHSKERDGEAKARRENFVSSRGRAGESVRMMVVLIPITEEAKAGRRICVSSRLKNAKNANLIMITMMKVMRMVLMSMTRRRRRRRRREAGRGGIFR